MFLEKTQDSATQEEAKNEAIGQTNMNRKVQAKQNRTVQNKTPSRVWYYVPAIPVLGREKREILVAF